MNKLPKLLLWASIIIALVVIIITAYTYYQEQIFKAEVQRLQTMLARILTHERDQMSEREENLYGIFERTFKHFPFTDMEAFMRGNAEQAEPGFIPTIPLEKTKFYYLDQGVFYESPGNDISYTMTNRPDGRRLVFIASFGQVLYSRLDGPVSKHYEPMFPNIVNTSDIIIEAWLNRFIIDGHVQGLRSFIESDIEALKIPPSMEELMKRVIKKGKE